MKRVKGFMAALLVICLVVGLNLAAEAQAPRVGLVVLDLTGNYFQIKLAEYVKEAGEAIGAEVSVHAPPSFGDYEGQVSIIENLIVKQVDVIILVSGHPQALVPAVDKAYKAGIPVVNIDNRVESDKVVTYIGTDNIKGAYKAGKYIAEKIGGKGKVALLTGESGNPNEVYRTTGFKQAIAEYPDIELVAEQNSHWTEEGGLEITENVLQVHPDLAAIFAENDGAALGAAQAAKAKGATPIIVGFDGIPEAFEAVKDGSITATVAQFPDKMAQIGVRLGLAYKDYLKDVEGLIEGPVISPVIDTGVAVVDLTNVKDFE